MPTQGHPPRGYPQWIFWVLAAAIILLGFTVLVQSVGGHSVSVQVVVGLVLIAALLTFLPRVTDVEKFVMNRGGMTLELAVQVASEAKAAAVGASERADEAVSQADKATKEAEDARTKLDRFIFLSMPKPTYANLVKLAGPERFGPYNLNEGFVSQLRFLRDAGYIDVDRHVGELHGSDDLSRHVQVTELGREFIANRRRLVPNEQL
jgi:hypothetical protein